MDKRRLVDESIDYIMEHLEEDLSLDVLAAHFYISKYHFDRIFKEKTGESIYAFIKRCKIDESAIAIKLDPEKAITEIGLEYGYSPSNFSSVFKKRHATSPTGFKRSSPIRSKTVPFDPERVACFKTAEEYDTRIEIQERNGFFVLYERYIGDYKDIEANWYRFLDRYEAFFSEKTVLAERLFNDPAVTGPTQCICDICMSVEEDCGLDNVMWLKGGRWAVYPFDGKIEDIYEALQGVFSVWLPQSGYKMRERYGLDLYHQIDLEDHRVVMDLCIPVE